MKGMQKLGGSIADQLTELSKRTGGIPGFAQDAFKQMGVDPKVVDKAHEEGKKS